MTFTINDLIVILKELGLEVASDISGDELLSELGMDSLDVFNLFAEIDAKYSVVVADSDFEELDTINKIVSFIDGKLDG